MRATMRITWLLLSLGLLFHSVCSNNVTPNATSVSKDATSVTPGPTVAPAFGTVLTTKPTVVTSGSTAQAAITVVATAKKGPTQAPTTTVPIAIVTTPAIAEPATSKPTTIKLVPTQTQPPTAINNPSAPPTGIKSVTPAAAKHATPAAAKDATLAAAKDVTPAAATPGLTKTTKPSATADSSGSTVVLPNAATTQTSQASVPSKTSGTVAPVNVGTTKIPKISTVARTPEQRTMVHTTLTPTSQQDSKAGDGKLTVTVTSHGQTPSRTPGPAGNTGTTNTPSIPTKTGPPAAKTLSTKAGTTSLQITPTTTSTSTATTVAQQKTFLYSLNNGQEKEEQKELVEVCRRLMANLQDGNCTLTWRHHNGKLQFDCVEINGKVKTSLATQYYEEITKKPTDNKTLIAILASCGALLIMIVILAVCASHHRKPYNENQQHLTEELHTVENGYHDNPTLEVMEVQPEMQEKKMVLNGEFNDSWIVPIDNLLKEDILDEEDTHL